MGASHSRVPAKPTAPPAKSRAPPAQVKSRPAAPIKKHPVSQAQQPSKPSIDDEDAAAAQALFSACARRDSWLDAIVTAANDEPWLAERSQSAHKHKQGGGDSIMLEKLAIHRLGSSVIAVIVVSTLAEVGDVLWIVDERERTTTSFGQPGWGGRLLGDQCVLLVDESADGRVVLYFYSGQICQLRCWRRLDTPHDGVAPPNPQWWQQRRPESAGVQSQHRQKESSRSSEHRSRRHAKTPKPKPIPNREASRPQQSLEIGAPAGGDGSSVAAWATDKDLAMLLVGACSTFAHALPGLRDLPQHGAPSLRAQPALLRKIYRRALLTCHPDKHVASPPQRQAIAIALFHALSGAHAAMAAAEARGTMAC